MREVVYLSLIFTLFSAYEVFLLTNFQGITFMNSRSQFVHSAD